MKTRELFYNILTTIVVFGISLTVVAQSDSTMPKVKYTDVEHDEIQTLFGSDIKHGGYLGFSMGFSQIDNKEI